MNLRGDFSHLCYYLPGEFFDRSMVEASPDPTPYCHLQTKQHDVAIASYHTYKSGSIIYKTANYNVYVSLTLKSCMHTHMFLSLMM